MLKNNKLSPSLLLSLALTFAVWAVFYPGIFSVDSLYIYREASLGKITDIHSSFVTGILFLFLKMGGTIDLLILLQCLFGFLGIRRFVLTLTGLFFTERKIQEWTAVLVLILFSSPLTPMPIYFATFWLDTWLAIFLIWILALLLELGIDTNSNIFRKHHFKMGILITLIIFAMLTRKNSPILYPALMLGLISVFRHKSISYRTVLIMVFCPLFFYLLFSTFQYKFLGVKQTHHERVFFALDLASMLIYNPSICQTLSLQSCDLIIGKISPEFIPGHGAIDHTMNQGLGTMDPAFVKLTISPFLDHDLYLAISHAPWTYVTVKTLNFLDYIHPRDQYYYQSYIHPNNLGLAFNPIFEPIRNKYFNLLRGVYQHPLLKYFSFVHFPWILINLFGIMICLIFKNRLPNFGIMGIILLTPATYYFSYLIALTASDFRYMYPSTLLMQVIVSTFLIRTIVQPAIASRWHDSLHR